MKTLFISLFAAVAFGCASGGQLLDTTAGQVLAGDTFSFRDTVINVNPDFKFVQIKDKIKMPGNEIDTGLPDVYQVRNFGYTLYGSRGAEDEPSSSPEFIFLRKSGNCDAYAAFTLHCLRRAGYKSWHEVLRDKHHITALFESDGWIYILDNAWRFQNFTGLSGPFRDRQSALNAFN